jgi:hypothetical protein
MNMKIISGADRPNMQTYYNTVTPVAGIKTNGVE